MESPSENIKVVVRVRDLINREKEQARAFTVQDATKIVQLSNTKPWTFDRVFSHEEDNFAVYHDTALDIIESSISGYHGTIFAYGQTSSGKTHTMMGNEKDPGVIRQAVEQLFYAVEETPDRYFLMQVSYMEIYNETVMDLLVPVSERVDLKVRETEQGEVFVENVKTVCVTDASEVLNLMAQGEKNRHYAETKMNDRSSRSHTIFRIILESANRTEDTVTDDGTEADEGKQVMVSHLNLVDLAGSERASQTGAEGARLKEGANINTSLLTLGLVIKKLSAGDSFINYRGSKLTRILQNSLGGNAKTAIICTVTPAQMSEEQTVSTLRFASQAKNIKTHAVVNEVIDEKAKINRLEKEVAELQKKLEEQMVTSATEELKENLDRERREKETQIAKVRELQEKILVSSLPAPRSSKSIQSKKERRETWAAPRVRHTMSRHSIGLALSIPHSLLARRAVGSPLLARPKMTAPDEELVEEESNVNDSVFVMPEIQTRRKPRRQVQFQDCLQEEDEEEEPHLPTTPDFGNHSILDLSLDGGTPKAIIRDKYKRVSHQLQKKDSELSKIQREFSELQEFTRLEKEVGVEDERRESRASAGDVDMDRAQQRIKFLEKNFSDSESLNREMGKELRETRVNLNTTTAKLEELEDRYTTVSQSEADLRAKWVSLQTLHETVTTDLKTLAGRAQQLENEKRDFDIRLEMAVASKDIEISDLRKYLECAYDDIAVLEREDKEAVKERFNRLHSLEARIRELEASVEAKDRELAELQQGSELQERVDHLTEGLTVITAELEAMAAEKVKLEAALDAMVAEKKAGNSERQQQHSEAVAGLEAQLASMEKQLRESEQRANNLDLSSQSLLETVDDLSRKNEELSQRAGELGVMVADLENLNRELGEEVNQLKAELSTEKAARERFEVELDQLRLEVEEGRETIDSLQNQLKAMEIAAAAAAPGSAQQEIISVTPQCSTQDLEQIATLRESLRVHELKVGGLEQELSRLGAEKEELEALVSETQEKLQAQNENIKSDMINRLSATINTIEESFMCLDNTLNLNRSEMVVGGVAQSPPDTNNMTLSSMSVNEVMEIKSQLSALQELLVNFNIEDYEMKKIENGQLKKKVDQLTIDLAEQEKLAVEEREKLTGELEEKHKLQLKIISTKIREEMNFNLPALEEKLREEMVLAKAEEVSVLRRELELEKEAEVAKAKQEMAMQLATLSVQEATPKKEVYQSNSSINSANPLSIDDSIDVSFDETLNLRPAMSFNLNATNNMGNFGQDNLEMQMLRTEVNSLREELERKTIALEKTTQARCQDLSIESQSLAEELETAKANTQDGEDSSKSNESQGSLESYRLKVTELTSTVERLNQEMDSLKEEIEIARANTKDNEDSSKSNESLRGSLENYKLKVTELTSTVETLNQEMDSLKEERESLQASVENSKLTIAELEELKSKFEILNHEMNSSREEKTSIDNSEANSSGGISESGDLGQTVDTLNQEINCLKEENGSLKTSLENTNLKIAELEELKSSFANLNQEMESLKEEKESLEISLENSIMKSVEFEDLKSTVETLNQQVQSLKEEKESIETALENSCKLKMAEVEELKSTVETLNHKIDSLQKEKEILDNSQENNSLRISEVEELKQTVENLNLQLLSLREERESLETFSEERKLKIAELEELIPKIETLNQEINSLKEERESLGTSLESSKLTISEFEELKTSFATLNQEMDALKEEKESLEISLENSIMKSVEFEDLKSTVEALHLQVDSLKEERESIENSSKLKMAEVEELKSTVETLNRKIDALQKEKELLENSQENSIRKSEEFDDLKSTVEALHLQVDSLKEEKQALETSLENSNLKIAELEELKSSFATLSQEMDALKEEKESLEISLENSIMKITELEELEQSVGNLKKEMDSLKEEKETALENSQMKIAELEKNSKSNDELSSTLETLKKNMDELKMEKESLEASLEQHKQRELENISQVQLSNTDLSRKLEALESQILEQAELKSHISELEHYLSTEKTKVQEYRERIEELESQLGANSDKSCDLQSQLEEVHQQIADKSAQCCNLLAQISTVKGRLEDSELEKRELLEKLDMLSQDNSELTVVKKQAENFERECQNLKDICKDLETCRAEKAREVKQLEQKLVEMVGEHDHARAELAQELEAKQELTAELAAKLRSLEGIDRENTEMREVLRCRGSDLETVTREKVQLEKELEAVTREKEQLEKELDSSKSVLASPQNLAGTEDIATLKLKIEDLLEDLESVTRWQKAAEEQRDIVDQECDRLEEELANITSRYEKEKGALEEEVRNLRQREQEIKDEYADVQEQLLQHKNSTEKLSTQSGECVDPALEEELTRLKAELTRVKGELGRRNVEYASLKVDVDREELHYQKECQRLKGDLEYEKKTVQRLTQEVRRAQSEKLDTTLLNPRSHRTEKQQEKEEVVEKESKCTNEHCGDSPIWSSGSGYLKEFWLYELQHKSNRLEKENTKLKEHNDFYIDKAKEWKGRALKYEKILQANGVDYPKRRVNVDPLQENVANISKNTSATNTSATNTTATNQELKENLNQPATPTEDLQLVLSRGAGAGGKRDFRLPESERRARKQDDCKQQ